MHVQALRLGARGFVRAVLCQPTEAEIRETLARKSEHQADLLADIARSFAESNTQRRFTMLPLPADLHRVDELVPQAPKGVL